MPVVKVYVPAGVLNPDQRREVVKGIHDVVNRVEKRPVCTENSDSHVLVMQSAEERL